MFCVKPELSKYWWSDSAQLGLVQSQVCRAEPAHPAVRCSETSKRPQNGSFRLKIKILTFCKMKII